MSQAAYHRTPAGFAGGAGTARPLTPGGGGRRRWLRPAAVALAVAVLAALAAGTWAWGRLNASLPALDGEVAVAGLAAPVTVTRDALGVPTVRATGERAAARLDVARALGFLHAQERFFQMDLMRRRAAGELAELFGPVAVEADTRSRVHRFRHRGEAALAAMPAADRELLAAYADGVAAGLAAQAAPPFEYLVLGEAPRRWEAVDTLLVVYAMYLVLQSDGPRSESAHGTMHDLLPEPLYDFLAPWGTPWDAPLAGGPLPGPPPPGPEVFDLRRQPPPELPPERTPAEVEELSFMAYGSNNWAVAGARTAHGGALLAGDMHLGLGLPNTWYRASLVYPAAGGGLRRVTGVTLPGAPGVIAGSNGRIAWSFTNSQGDWSDLVLVEPAEVGGEDGYLTARGPRPFARRPETVRVRGGEDVAMEVLETIWGPVVDRDHAGRRRVLRWVAHEPEGADMALLGLAEAAGVDTAVAVAAAVGMPAQNLVVADADGRIAWTLTGPMPRRFGHDGRLPSSWAAGDRGWDGWLPAAERPAIVDPPEGLLWTANARTVGGDGLARMGDGSYALGARAGQIRDRLRQLDGPAEADMLALQLDDRALFLSRWRELLLEVLAAPAGGGDPRRAALRREVGAWGGRAAIGSVGYRAVRAFRLLVAERVLGAITAECRAADPSFSPAFNRQAEGPLWQLVSRRPQHLLDPAAESWEALLAETADRVIELLTAAAGELAGATWGQHNTVTLRHPLSGALPLAGRWLDLDPAQLPGDTHMPRVQTPSHGASQRMAVSPGREADGIFHMPGGQSGHPLSPYYGAGTEAWEQGEPTPFLPGPPEHTLTLVPGDSR